MFDQSPFDCRVEWGQRGAREAAERGDITIIVDVLSFSSTTVTALQYGALLFPYPSPMNSAKAYAARIGAEILLGRAKAVRLGGRSLSPISFQPSDHGRRIVLCSLNGAACTAIASKVPALLIGSLLNASAAALAANRMKVVYPKSSITVVPCGEQWECTKEGENKLRPGIEDYLGAGAIVSKLDGSKSPEAQICAAAFESMKSTIGDLVWDCGSGRELRDRGFAEDVKHCARLDAYNCVPMLKEDHFIDAADDLLLLYSEE